MKTLHIFALLLSLSLFSCTKSNTESINSDSSNNQTTVLINPDLIIGKWNLTEMGKNNSAKQTKWSKTTTNEILDFKNTGMFIKELKDWSNCTGSFKISNSRLVTNSNCQVEENIIELTQTTLIFETQNLLTRYKYTRMW